MLWDKFKNPGMQRQSLPRLVEFSLEHFGSCGNLVPRSYRLTVIEMPTAWSRKVWVRDKGMANPTLEWNNFWLGTDIALVLFCLDLGLVHEIRATFSTNQIKNLNQSRQSYSSFPALEAVCVFLLWALIGC